MEFLKFYKIVINFYAFFPKKDILVDFAMFPVSDKNKQKKIRFRGKRKTIFVLTLVVVVYSLDRVLFERECVILCVFSVFDWRLAASHTAGTLQLGH